MLHKKKKVASSRVENTFPKNNIHNPKILNTYTPQKNRQQLSKNSEHKHSVKKNRQQLSRLEAKQRRAGKAGKATRDEMLAVMKKQAVSWKLKKKSRKGYVEPCQRCYSVCSGRNVGESSSWGQAPSSSLPFQVGLILFRWLALDLNNKITWWLQLMKEWI